MPAIGSITRKRGKGKVKISAKRKKLQAMTEQLGLDNLDVTVALIQALIPCGLEAVKEKLQKEVAELAGKRYEHGKENVRWGRQGGSIYLQDQKVPIEVPRVRNKRGDIEIPLETYQKLQAPFQSDEKVMLKLLCGISTRKYGRSAELVPEVFGISSSNLSKRFKEKTAEMVKKLKTRSLRAYDFICIFIDGKRYADDGLLVVMGITMEGKKVILDIDHTHSENSRVTDRMFERLIERGLRFEEGILFVIDGSKGLIKGIQSRFQEYGFIQRCQWHKEQNVTSYLKESQKEMYRRRLKKAYRKTTYNEAKSALEMIHHELSEINQSAADSLSEGLEETLTLHRLGLSLELGKSLTTTNCMESIMAQLGQYTDKVDRWRNSSQLLRWTAAGLLEIEPQLRRIYGFRYLKVLRFKMKEEIQRRKEKKYEYMPTEREMLEEIGV